METTKRVHFNGYHKLNKFVTALSFVVAGLVILGHNLGAVNDYIFRIVISWQMLLVVVGIASFIKRNLLAGCIYAGIGIYFLLPRMTGTEGAWLSAYWPLFLVLFGLILLLHRHRNPFQRWRHHDCQGDERGRRTEHIIDGFVTVDISFGGSRHIVLDPVFRGADLDNTFGSITLDLRRTSLEAPETYIDVDCSFGAVELYIPPQWCLFSEMDNTFSSNEDKRFMSQEVDTEHKVIVRGNISFGALEIRN
ncbi:MAG: cell wall-active antibiotics response protein [Tannerellaceae bacterium]|jgi:hypothetical protein|nr:cell wall-active antibiotics response protein [Tannerellaceae bacterium]